MAIQPPNHLIVGLGGSGGKIIRELRKSIRRSHKDIADSRLGVLFEYIYLDTSEDEVSKAAEWTVLGSPVDLETSQILINKASQIRPVLEDAEAFPGLAPWIEPRSVFDFVKSTTAGAAQKRKLGRLVFAQNAKRFVATLDQRIGVLAAKSGKVGATIHVVCGLAGGTGSGSVVDAVAQIRQRYPEPDLYPIVIYALLPERSAPPHKAKTVGAFSNYYANAYAALAELNAMAVGQYQPINVLDGQPMKHDVYFNGCYLVNNVNEHAVSFDVDVEVPRIVAEFIYQKTLNASWDGLGRAEKGENDVKNYELEPGAGKARAKLFLSFGIERVVVPEEEIKEYLAYGFAEQATRQLMYNNFRQGEGYADEAVQKDWRSEARKGDLLQSLLLTDGHLMLETGILEDDQKNTLWKPSSEYWKLIVARLTPEIRADKTIEQSDWINTLQARLGKVYDETYRTLGGVAKFYQTKGKARLDMARHVGLTVEKGFFEKWKSGQSSLLQLRQLMDALLEGLEERQGLFNDAVANGPAELQKIHARLTELSGKFNNVGFLGKHLTDRRESLFSEIASLHQELAVSRATLEGRKFATTLLPFLRDELLQLRSRIDELQQKIAAATVKINLERAAQLKCADSAYQKRVFDPAAIDEVMRHMTVDEQSQEARTQQIRRAIIELAGKETDTFGRLLRSASESSLIETLSQESARVVEQAHAELSKAVRPVLNVNIVERLASRYDANPGALKSFVRSLYDEAGCTLRFNQGEVDRTTEGNAGGSSGRQQTIGVFLPECESNGAFRKALVQHFEGEKTAGASTEIKTSAFSNQIVVMKISSLMPVRFVDGLDHLKSHYDGLLKDETEAHLLHGQGNGSCLPPLFARTSAEVKAKLTHKPSLLAARLLNIVRQRKNKTSGLDEWVFVQMVDDLPLTSILTGREWFQVVQSEHPPEVIAAVGRAVRTIIQKDYQHVERKQELDAAYKGLMRERFVASGDDDQDEEYQFLAAQRPTFRRDIVGLAH